METTDEKNPAIAPADNTPGHAHPADTTADNQNHSPAADAPPLSVDTAPKAPGIPVGSLSFLSNIQPDFWD